MSGIATTRKAVDQLEGTGCRLLDTRKPSTLPHLKSGENRRWSQPPFGLYDMIMIKDNHVDYAGSIGQALAAAQTHIQEKASPCHRD